MSEKQFVEVTTVALFVGIGVILLVSIVATSVEVQSLRARVARLEER